MSKRGYIEFLYDMKEAIVRIRNYIEGMSYEEFLSDEKTQDAVVRNLEIMGEAAKNIPESITEKYKQIPYYFT